MSFEFPKLFRESRFFPIPDSSDSSSSDSSSSENDSLQSSPARSTSIANEKTAVASKVYSVVNDLIGAPVSPVRKLSLAGQEEGGVKAPTPDEVRKAARVMEDRGCKLTPGGKNEDIVETGVYRAQQGSNEEQRTSRKRLEASLGNVIAKKSRKEVHAIFSVTNPPVIRDVVNLVRMESPDSSMADFRSLIQVEHVFAPEYPSEAKPPKGGHYFPDGGKETIHARVSGGIAGAEIVRFSKDPSSLQKTSTCFYPRLTQDEIISCIEKRQMIAKSGNKQFSQIQYPSGKIGYIITYHSDFFINSVFPAFYVGDWQLGSHFFGGTTYSQEEIKQKTQTLLPTVPKEGSSHIKYATETTCLIEIASQISEIPIEDKQGVFIKITHRDFVQQFGFENWAEYINLVLSQETLTKVYSELIADRSIDIKDIEILDKKIAGNLDYGKLMIVNRKFLTD